MIVNVYLIAEPGMDRVCVQTTPPTSYRKKEGAKVFHCVVDLPDFIFHDGKLEATIPVSIDPG